MNGISVSTGKLIKIYYILARFHTITVEQNKTLEEEKKQETIV